MADIDPLLELMKKLRDKDKGCPWDIKQDHNSIAHCSIEEAYELVAAITKNDQENIKEELGDVLLQVILFYIPWTTLIFISKLFHQLEKRVNISQLSSRLYLRI